MLRQQTTSTVKTLTALTTASSFSEVLLDEVIIEIKKLFIDGQQRNQELLEKISENPSMQAKFRPLDHDGDFLQFKDPAFPSYNANKIAGTNFIAAAGPKPTKIIDFFKNTVFHPTLDIQEIIAIGSILGGQYSDRRDLDFCDYMVGMYDSDFNFFSNDSEQIDIAIDKCKGQYRRPEFSSTCFPESIIESQLTVTFDKTETLESKDAIKPQKKKINVTLLPIADGRSIKLTEIKSNDSYYQVLWNLYQKYITQLIVVHCAAGAGRTGQLILMFELVKHHEEIDVIKDPVAKAKAILAILDRLRLNRPALVLTEGQLEHAIRGAEALYQYGLKQVKDLTTKTTTNESTRTKEIVTAPSIIRADSPLLQKAGLDFAVVLDKDDPVRLKPKVF